MCVYELQPASPPPYQAAPGCTDRFNAAPYLGCFEDKNNRRAFPYEVHGKGLSAEFCGMKCNQAGYKYFAREWRGQCFCGDYVSAYCMIEVKIENVCIVHVSFSFFNHKPQHILLHTFSIHRKYQSNTYRTTIGMDPRAIAIAVEEMLEQTKCVFGMEKREQQ